MEALMAVTEANSWLHIFGSSIWVSVWLWPEVRTSSRLRTDLRRSSCRSWAGPRWRAAGVDSVRCERAPPPCPPPHTSLYPENTFTSRWRLQFWNNTPRVCVCVHVSDLDECVLQPLLHAAQPPLVRLNHFLPSFSVILHQPQHKHKTTQTGYSSGFSQQVTSTQSTTFCLFYFLSLLMFLCDNCFC